MRILVADDEMRVLRMITRILERENFNVDTALDGEEAFQKVKSRKYDVIVLDIMMPEKTGFDIIAGLRVLGIETPILVISARTMVEDRVKALNLGADDYLVKNFSMEELVARVKGLLRRSASKASNVFYCGDLVVDFSDMTVKNKQKPVYLSKKEFSLLMTLMTKKNMIVTREELLDSVWDGKTDQKNSNTLDVHIRFLRKKINTPGEKSIVQTFRGRGYMLRDLKK